MGNYLNRNRTSRIEEVNQSSSNNAYLYPPKSGYYFASHFIMGGERFETCQPEAYLFGENIDLNFLGSKPSPFPYLAPLSHVPTRTLRALINIRKETLKLIKVNSSEKSYKNDDAGDSSKSLFNIEFIFDADVKCSIKIYYMCLEETLPSGLVYTSKDETHNSQLFPYNRGSNQLFSQPLHFFDPTSYKEEELAYKAFDEHKNFNPTVPFPIVIQCTAEEGEDPKQSHSLIAVVEKNFDSWTIKPFKQKIFIDGLSHLMQEIYGIENKNLMASKKDNTPYSCSDDEIEDNGSECVICMCDCRDTLILPCRHLCLCNNCADSLRYQANNCPICRAPFRALLQIKAVRKCSTEQVSSIMRVSSTPPTIPHHQHNIHQAHRLLSRSACDLMDVPPGYEPIPLLEALNGPLSTVPTSAHGMFTFKNSISDEDSESDTPLGVKKFDSFKAKQSNSLKRTLSSSQQMSLNQDKAEVEIEAASSNKEWVREHFLDSNNCEYKSNSLSSNDSSTTAGTNSSTQEKIKLLDQEKADEKGTGKENKSLKMSETEMTALKSPILSRIETYSGIEYFKPSSSNTFVGIKLEDEGKYIINIENMPMTVSSSAPNIASSLKDVKLEETKPKKNDSNKKASSFTLLSEVS